MAHTLGPWKALSINSRKRGVSKEYRIIQEAPRYPLNPDMRDCHLIIAEMATHRFGSGDNVPGDTMSTIADAYTEGCQADNVAFIIRACNCHDELVAACKASRIIYAGYMALKPSVGGALDFVMQQVREIEAAIAKAEGGIAIMTKHKGLPTIQPNGPVFHPEDYPFTITHVLIKRVPSQFPEAQEYVNKVYPAHQLPDGFTISPTWGDAFLMYKDDGTIKTACSRIFFQFKNGKWLSWPWKVEESPEQYQEREDREERNK